MFIGQRPCSDAQNTGRGTVLQRFFRQGTAGGGCSRASVTGPGILFKRILCEQAALGRQQSAQGIFGMSDSDFELDDMDERAVEEEGGEKNPSIKRLPLGTLAAHLMNGVVYSNESPLVYRDVLYFRTSLSGRLHELGLTVEINERDEYAYLRSLTTEEFGDQSGPMPPRLLKQIQLPFMTSFLLMQLRNKVSELERSNDARFFITFDEIYQRMEAYFKPGGDEGSKRRQLSGQVTRLCEMGILRKRPGRDKSDEEYEIKRIIKTVCNAQKMELFQEKLNSYIAEAARRNGRSKGEQGDE